MHRFWWKNISPNLCIVNGGMSLAPDSLVEVSEDEAELLINSNEGFV